LGTAEILGPDVGEVKVEFIGTSIALDCLQQTIVFITTEVVLLLDVLSSKRWSTIGSFQAHDLGDRIQDIDLKLLDLKTVSEVL